MTSPKPDVSLEEQIAFLEHEIKFHKEKFPDLVEAIGLYEAILASLKRLKERERREDILRHERDKFHAQFEHVIKHLTHIQMLLHSEDVTVNGKKFRFHPPDDLVRDTWEGLSKAIREIPSVIDAHRLTEAGKESDAQ